MFQLFPALLIAQNCSETGIAMDEYAGRRRALLIKTDTNAAIVMKSKDASGEYEMMHYRQDQNFLYLTGINEPGVYLLMSAKGIDFNGSVKKTVFFASSYSELNKDREKFSRETDTLLNTEEFRKIFSKLAAGISVLYFSAPDLGFANDWLNDNPYFILTEVKKKLKQAHPGLKIKDVGQLIAAMRQVKSPAEIGLTRKAVQMTGDGILHAMKTCKAGIREYELQAAVEFEMTKQEATRTYAKPRYPDCGRSWRASG